MNEILFWKLFHNSYIRYQILNQIEIYNTHQVVIYNSNDEIINDQFKDYRSKVIINFNGTLNEGILLSSSAKTIIFNDSYNQAIPERTLPIDQSLETIIFGRDYNKDIGVNVIPFGVQNLIFGQDFNCELVQDSIPSSVTNLVLSSHFDKPLYTLPSSIIRLHLGARFNYDLYSGSIPNCVQDLTLSASFSKQLKQSYTFRGDFKEGSIPSSVTKLSMGGFYNHELLPGLIPSSVTSLTLSSMFNQVLKPSSIPDSVTLLCFFSYNQVIYQQSLPQSIKHLDLGAKFNKQLNYLPKSLESLTLGREYSLQILPNMLPSTLKKLIFKDSKFNQILSSSTNLPSQLEVLKFCGHSSFNQPLYSLPSTLHTLKLSSAFEQVLDPNSIPSSVTKLTTSRLDPNSIPSSVTKLSFVNCNTLEALQVGLVPLSVKIIKFKSTFNQPIEAGAIKSAHTIYFGSSFNKQLELNAIPSTCTDLTFSSFSNLSITQSAIPDSVKVLSLTNLSNLVKGSIPNSVERLRIQHYYPYSFTDLISIPPSVKYLEVGTRLDQLNMTEDNLLIIPDSITSLTVQQSSLSPFYNRDIKFPKSLKSYIISYSLSIKNYSIKFNQSIINNNNQSSITNI